MTEGTGHLIDPNGDARRALHEAVAEHGPEALSNAVIMYNVCRDHLIGLPGESILIGSAARTDVPALLRELIPRLGNYGAIQSAAAALAQEHELDIAACLWVVREFARALGHIASGPATGGSGLFTGVGSRPVTGHAPRPVPGPIPVSGADSDELTAQVGVTPGRPAEPPASSPAEPEEAEGPGSASPASETPGSETPAGETPAGETTGGAGVGSEREAGAASAGAGAQGGSAEGEAGAGYAPTSRVAASGGAASGGAASGQGGSGPGGGGHWGGPPPGGTPWGGPDGGGAGMPGGPGLPPQGPGGAGASPPGGPPGAPGGAGTPPPGRRPEGSRVFNRNTLGVAAAIALVAGYLGVAAVAHLSPFPAKTVAATSSQPPGTRTSTGTSTSPSPSGSPDASPDASPTSDYDILLTKIPSAVRGQNNCRNDGTGFGATAVSQCSGLHGLAAGTVLVYYLYPSPAALATGFSSLLKKADFSKKRECTANNKFTDFLIDCESGFTSATPNVKGSIAEYTNTSNQPVIVSSDSRQNVMAVMVGTNDGDLLTYWKKLNWVVP